MINIEKRQGGIMDRVKVFWLCGLSCMFGAIAWEVFLNRLNGRNRKKK